MNIYFNIHNNTISIGKAPSKKEDAFFFSLTFDYPLDTLNNKKRAIHDFLLKDETKILKENNGHVLIISDETIGFGLFDIPKLSKRKMEDVFQTRFKMSYPNFNDYYVDYYEYEKNDRGSIYFYTIAKKKDVEEIIDVFSKSSISIKEVTFFGDAFVSRYVGAAEYPAASLIIGKNKAELIISKNGKPISINIIDYGLILMLDDDTYFDSPYNYGNDNSKKYAGFVQKTIGTKEVINDLNIAKTPAESGLKMSKPRELRILKDSALVSYNKRNNARKLYALIMDIIEYYSHDPWFLPIKEMKVNTSEEMFELLTSLASEDEELILTKIEFDESQIVQSDISGNKLYKKSLKSERRKIDWAKFFTMEIGKKKKA